MPRIPASCLIFTRNISPDILILNIQMAGLHGVFSIRELHAFYSECLFLIVSYSRKTDFKREGINIGIRGYLTKPLKRDKVISALKDVFREINYHKKHQIQEQLNKKPLIPLSRSLKTV